MEEKEIYAIDKEIAKVQNKLNELKEKRKKCHIKSLGEDYIGKYIRIRNLVDLRFNSYNSYLSSHLRFVGFSVRGVIR